MNQQFETLAQIIRNRRTVKPAMFNGKQIPAEQMEQILALADWAPTHGSTEPWRFYIYAGERVQDFCSQHAELYKTHTDISLFNPQTYENLSRMGDKASHVIISVMRRGDLPKIPALEEIASASVATQHILLGAEALGIAAYWGSGGMVYKPAMKHMLQLREEDVVLGALYLGYTDGPVKEGVRKVALQEKLHWM